MFYKNRFLLYLTLCVIISGILLSASVSVYALEGDEIIIHMKTDGLTAPPDVTAKTAIMVNLETGEPVYEKNSREIIYPASTVKIMTAILVMENVPDLQAKTIISEYVAGNVSGKRIGDTMSGTEIKAGEVFTVWELLNAMLLFGANDAAMAMAEHVSGSVPDFVSLMNEKAIELGCVSTVFTNPTGMHDDSMHTTAADTAKIAAYASQIPEIMDISSLQSKFVINPTNKTAAERTVYNRNYFVSKDSESKYYYPYARGINLGNTPEAGYCLTTVAEQKGLTYLCVVMGSTAVPSGDTEIPNSFSDAKSLFDWVFEIYSYKNIVSTSTKVQTVEIRLSANRDTVTLVPDRDIELLLPQNVDMDKEVVTQVTIYDEKLIAPISVDDILGEVTVLYNGEIKGRANLLAKANVEISNVLFIIEQIKNITSRVWFKASVIVFIILFAGYVVISLVRSNRREPKRFY